MRLFLLLTLLSGYAVADGHTLADNDQLEAAISDTVAVVVEEDMDLRNEAFFDIALAADDEQLIEVTELRAPIVTVVEIDHP